jgi:outer membrane protein assembly factor BamB
MTGHRRRSTAYYLLAAVSLLSVVLLETKRARADAQDGGLLPVAAAVAGPVTADAESVGWPFLRGPNYDGHSAETQLADSWPDEGPPVLWSRALGQGYSGFVAWNDRIATQYQTLGGQYVICLSADTGQTLWEHRYDWPYEPASLYPGPRATPTYHQGRLYFAGPRGTIGCLDAASGRLLWRVNLNEQFGASGTDFGYSCSPTVVDGKVILPVGGHGASMVALDAIDGSIVWKAGDDAASYTPAYPITFRGRPLVLGYLQNALVCHDLATGKLIWRHALSSGYNEHSAWPIYIEPHLWISGPFRAGSELLELTGRADGPLRTLWKSKLMSNDIFSSVLVDGALYGFDLREAQAKAHRSSRGQFRCIDFLTGREYWSTGSQDPIRTLTPSKSDAGTRIGHATVLVADGKLFLFNDMGELILARAMKSRYEELGRVSVLGGEICWTQPTLNRRRLFVRNQSRGVCVYVGEPQLLTPQARASALTAADIPQSKYIDVTAAVLGVEPEYAFDIPSNAWLQQWFFVSLFILGFSLLMALAARWVLGRRLASAALRWLFWAIAFVLGAAGTTVISTWTGDFVFTWPVPLFVAFQAAAFEIKFGVPRPGDAWLRWRPRLVAATFVACCVVYFLLCRRLSLVFEWVFLCGFAGALPFALAGSHFFPERRWRFAWFSLMTAAAFASFYWFAVAVLWLKGRS